MNFLNRNFLAKELDRWQSEGIVDKDTAFKIANLYGIDPDAHSEKMSFVLKLVAYLFFALAFFYPCWRKLGGDTKARAFSTCHIYAWACKFWRSLLPRKWQRKPLNGDVFPWKFLLWRSDRSCGTNLSH